MKPSKNVEPIPNARNPKMKNHIISKPWFSFTVSFCLKALMILISVIFALGHSVADPKDFGRDPDPSLSTMLCKWIKHHTLFIKKNPRFQKDSIFFKKRKYKCNIFILWFIIVDCWFFLCNHVKKINIYKYKYIFCWYETALILIYIYINKLFYMKNLYHKSKMLRIRICMCVIWSIFLISGSFLWWDPNLWICLKVKIN